MAYAVLTRDEADVGPYAVALAPLGLEVVPMPVTRTAPPVDAGALRRALIAGPFDCVVVTSRRVAAELADAARACGVQLPTVWAVGEATRAALARAGIAAVCADGVRDGEGLGRALVVGSPQRVLVPRAEDGRDEPIATLRAAGWAVTDVIAYRTVAVGASDPARARGAAMLAAGAAAMCCVFAPSQVVALGSAVAAGGATLVWVAIGETTATALRAAGAVRVAVAAAPTPEGIANAAGAVYRSEP